MKNLYRELLIKIGEDPEREGLKDTPARVEESMLFLTKGYRESLEEITRGAIFESEMDEMVIVKNIEFYSLCEHHLVPFFGKCYVGYMPTGKVIGLSKVARIIDLYARRLQIQERLTQQIAQSIMEVTQAAGVAVVMEAQHLCMMMRGVEKQHSVMTTSMMLGTLREQQSTRMEFLSLIRE